MVNSCSRAVALEFLEPGSNSVRPPPGGGGLILYNATRDKHKGLVRFSSGTQLLDNVLSGCQSFSRLLVDDVVRISLIVS